jgi:hypothetical protein
MSSDPSSSRSDDIRPHRQSFDVPHRFNRTTDAPCPTQDSITDAFIYRTDTHILGYIVVKRLSSSNGVFWSIEEYRYNGRYQEQVNSYGTEEKSAVPEFIEHAAANIRSHTVPTSK